MAKKFITVTYGCGCTDKYKIDDNFGNEIVKKILEQFLIQECTKCKNKNKEFYDTKIMIRMSKKMFNDISIISKKQNLTKSDFARTCFQFYIDYLTNVNSDQS